ncbi:MAG: nuclear transport factor 2 family protein, partial [Thauera phenolivorans]|nr:nuclear transport factor 2 family protein [Thauera phenolivorans]
ALVRCGGTDPDDKETSGWMRMTACYRRRDGRWRVIHEHFSAPFDPQDDKVLWLEP